MKFVIYLRRWDEWSRSLEVMVEGRRFRSVTVGQSIHLDTQRPEPPTINAPATGSQDVDETLLFAELLCHAARAARALEGAPWGRPFEGKMIWKRESNPKGEPLVHLKGDKLELDPKGWEPAPPLAGGAS